MRALHTYPVLVVLFLASMFMACEKEKATTNAPGLENVTVYPDADVYWAIGAVAGDGVVLLVYGDNAEQIRFKLIDNAGYEIWTKTFGYTYNPNDFNSFSNINVIFDADNTFAIFSGTGLKKINLAGDVVFNDDDFLGALANATIHKIMLGNNDAYVALGVIGLGGQRAFISEISRTGHQNFIKLYAVNTIGLNVFTGAVKTATGGYLAAGSFASNTAGLASAFFTMKLAPNGDILALNKTEIDSCVCHGRDFIQLGDNSYAYVLSPGGFDLPENRTRVYRINDTATVLGLSFINLAKTNFGAGYTPFFGNGLVQTNSGALLGIIKSGFEGRFASSSFGFPLTYTAPHYGYYYALNANAARTNQAYLNTYYSNYLNSIVTLSNGHALVFGTTLSLGDETKLITIEM
jgi:hypothetical protein